MEGKLKTNIVLVGFDLPFLNEFAYKLSDVLKYKYIDMNQALDSRLLDNVNMPINIQNIYAEQSEQNIYSKVAELDAIVSTIHINDYIANNNYEIFDNSYIILVTKNLEDKLNLNKNIINFAKKHVDLILNQENLVVQDVLNKLRG